MTLVTLDCTPFDIAMSVSGEGDPVYSPAVLRPRGHHAEMPTQLFRVNEEQPLLKSSGLSRFVSAPHLDVLGRCALYAS